MNVNLKLKYQSSKGFHFILAKIEQDKVPESFFIQSENLHTFVLTTLELLKYNERIRESLEEIFLLSDKYALCILAIHNFDEDYSSCIRICAE